MTEFTLANFVIEPFNDMRPFSLWRARESKIHNGPNLLYY